MQKNLLGRLMLDLDSHSLTDEEKHISTKPPGWWSDFILSEYLFEQSSDFSLPGN